LISIANTTNADSMILRKCSAAFAAGCTIVIKPSPESPASVLALSHLAEKAGFPKGVINVLTTDLDNTPALSEALCRHDLVKKVTFTGSVSLHVLCLRNLTCLDASWKACSTNMC
jgi:succinate-semialdehyde dehydrogenase/glutarate-semialdehyde dehydrogenase